MNKPILATPANMRKYAQHGLFAYDRYSKAEWSASAGDYWTLDENQPLTGMFGKPLILATRSTFVVTLCEPQTA